MWRFVLGPGVCGDPAWTGILVPSVDKVGRYFPLTFALEVREPAVDLTPLASKQTWYAALESTALSALNIDYTVDALEQALAANPFPRETNNESDSAAHELANWLATSGALPFNWDFGSVHALDAAIQASAGLTLGAIARGRSFWWCVEQQSGATELHCTSALPEADYYAVLLGSAATAGTVQ
jgi:type VI secretion system protein ImpM